MPTPPIERILNRDLSRVAANDIASRICPMLDEIVNYGTNLYARHTHQLSDIFTAEGVPLLIYLHILEMTDGASILLHESAVSASIPPARAAFESALALEFILKEDSTNRAHAWLVGYMSEQIDVCDKILGQNAPGQKLATALAADTLKDDIDLSVLLPLATRHRKYWEKELARPELAAAIAQRAASRKPYPHWYSSFGGPSNLRGLASRLNREAQYNVLYGHVSSIAHGQNLRHFAVAAQSKDPLVRLLREPSGFNMVGGLAAAFALRGTHLLSAKYDEMDQYRKWYTAEIRKAFRPEAGA
jgi:hypothetical protein